MKVKPHWDVDAPEFAGDLTLDAVQSSECFCWYMDRRSLWYRAGLKGPDVEGLLKLMDAADLEGAPHHVRHFLWSMLHFPERVVVFHHRRRPKQCGVPVNS
jgi:hypothetical protein